MTLKASDIAIIIYHPDLGILSDRTFRQLLKKISKACRKVLSNEIREILHELDLSDRERQSLNDQVKNKLKHSETYYVEQLSRNSTEITIVLTGLGYFLLANTIGETIKDAWRESNAYQKLKDLLLKDWRVNTTPKIIENQFSGESLAPFFIGDFNTHVEEENTFVEFQLGTYKDEEGRERTFEKKLFQDSIYEIDRLLRRARMKTKEVKEVGGMRDAP